jgi:hypothetical protein
MDFGCGFAQGYLYSAPIEADALQQLLGKPIAPSASVSTSSKIVMKETEFEVEVPTEQLAQKSVGAR